MAIFDIFCVFVVHLPKAVNYEVGKKPLLSTLHLINEIVHIDSFLHWCSKTLFLSNFVYCMFFVAFLVVTLRCHVQDGNVTSSTDRRCPIPRIFRRRPSRRPQEDPEKQELEMPDLNLFHRWLERYQCLEICGKSIPWRSPPAIWSDSSCSLLNL